MELRRRGGFERKGAARNGEDDELWQSKGTFDHGVENRTMKITVETTVHAPLEEVWRAWTTPADIKQWNAASDDWHTTAATVDLRIGGIFSSRMEAKDGSMGFDFTGTYTKIVPHELIGCEFGGRELVVEFIPVGQAVTVRETFDAEETHSPEQQRAGWQAILDRFAQHVEGRGSSSGRNPESGRWV
jgi:uncharacterized protein YndB with AHSA1/START domain